MSVQIGDIVYRRLCITKREEDGQNAVIKGTVIYIHPKKRFHTVEFQFYGGAIRECYLGV